MIWLENNALWAGLVVIAAAVGIMVIWKKHRRINHAVHTAGRRRYGRSKQGRAGQTANGKHHLDGHAGGRPCADWRIFPAWGKTTLALAFARALDLKESRVQFTPDVLPSDLVGFSVYQKETGKFVYHAGAVMCNLFLGDEINRTSSRTQSALLEVMEEGTVTVDGVTRRCPHPLP